MGIGSARPALSYPSNAGQGYPFCAPCHIAPDGGGVLTNYGRQAGAEGMATWMDGEWEAKAGYGLLENPGVNFGGDVRSIGIKQQSGNLSTDRSFLMQADSETAIKLKNVTIAFLAGEYGPQALVQSRRHYLLANYGKMSFRLGKFFPAYGINLVDHSSLIRSGLGLDEGQETYNLETVYRDELGEAFITAVKGGDGTGASVRLSAFVAGRFNLGASGFYYLHADRSYRTSFGLHSILGFSPALWMLAQVDLKTEIGPGPLDFLQTGLGYVQIGYAVVKGFHLLSTIEYSMSYRRLVERASNGIEWIPRPHWEFGLYYGLERDKAGVGMYATALAHYWL